jgi:hypothetical protein
MSRTEMQIRTPDVDQEWLDWRGGVHTFPVTPSLTYREYLVGVAGGNFGRGLLSPNEPEILRVMLPELGDAYRAELLIFGTGHVLGPSCWINDNELPLNNLSELATGQDQYECLSYSANRVYSLCHVPLTALRAGENVVRVNRCHAFWQVAVLRIFEETPQAQDLELDVVAEGSGYRLRLTGPSTADIVQAEFFARHRGIDVDVSAQEASWQAILNRNVDSAIGYDVSGHIGSVAEAPWQAEWHPELVPSGSVQLRARVRTADGFVVESPGGILERTHHAPSPLLQLRSIGFRPFAFHIIGANQNLRTEVEFKAEGPSWNEVREMTVKRAVLSVPLYGLTEMRLNERQQLFALAPIADYAVRHVELHPSWLYTRINHLELRASGQTGCFQAPGPMLTLAYE